MNDKVRQKITFTPIKPKIMMKCQTNKTAEIKMDHRNCFEMQFKCE